jgi:hypothetical protein
MGRFVAFIGNLAFACLLVNFAFAYGTRWEFGPHGLLKSVVAEDGCHYGDGKPIDDITLALVRSGGEEVYQLVLIGCVAIIVAYVVYHRRQAARDWERVREIYLKAFEFDIEQSGQR